jgi:hypothetical protein
MLWKIRRQDASSAGRISQHGWPTKDILDLLLRSIKRVSKLSSRIRRGCVEVSSREMIFSIVACSFPGTYLHLNIKEFLGGELPMSLQMQNTQTRLSGRNRAVMRGWLTTSSETENFPISPGSRLQTRDVSSLNNSVISTIMSSHPKKTQGFRGIR